MELTPSPLTPQIVSALFNNYGAPVIVFPAVQIVLPFQFTPVINTTLMTAQEGIPVQGIPINNQNGQPINVITEPLLTRLRRETSERNALNTDKDIV